MTEVELAWLAGLLEGEGSFMKGPPSAPNTPRIVIEMTDEQIVRRVAEMFEVRYHETRAKRRNPHWNVAFRTALRGKPAVALMLKLYPFMGERRQDQIATAIDSHQPIQ